MEIYIEAKIKQSQFVPQDGDVPAHYVIDFNGEEIAIETNIHRFVATSWREGCASIDKDQLDSIKEVRPWN